ncbi:hypothetical protein R3X27_00965 [Tropicimonas sp. TH_r6]|uniref:hypothetical protein n=1 Tax=Tropicimonas sp. TH_r6 TaxID=3082085 RepID=UPI002954A7D0|nr:hypothetical protein [Tropicimonas sp. TH_r6]MDV7141242.1 hypothetical protein [Tropicimonas sp. TH_r6]
MERENLIELADRIAALPISGARALIALAGPPASGKSRAARELVDELHSRGLAAVAVPMDGFHLDNEVLDARGLRARKGSPETFDAAGFIHAMARLKQEAEVILPSFDREIDKSVAGSVVIGPEDRIAVVEGNYVCFSEAPWDQLAGLWDFSCYLDVPEDVLLERLVQRWIRFDHSPEDAEARARGNDLANAQRIATAVSQTDLRF